MIYLFKCINVLKYKNNVGVVDNSFKMTVMIFI